MKDKEFKREKELISKDFSTWCRVTLWHYDISTKAMEIPSGKKYKEVFLHHSSLKLSILK